MDAYLTLEHEFGKWLGNPNTVACNSGTAALHLALEAMRFAPRASIVIPDFTMVACARAASLADMVPVFVDCKDDLTLDPGKLGQIQAAAVMPVHIYGRRCDMDPIHAWARDRCALVVEDLAEAHGVLPHPDTDAACWSFYRNKIVCGEEGGMIAFKDPRHAEYARMLRSLGFTSQHNFYHLPRGMNYRLANALASLILPSLDRMRPNLVARQRVCDWYDELVPVAWQMPERDVVWVYDLRIPGLTTMYQDALVSELNRAGVAARHAFQPMSKQIEYPGHIGGSHAARLAQEVIYLPVLPTYQREDAALNVGQLLTIWNRVRRM